MRLRERLFALEAFGIKLGLDNIQTILTALDRPDRRWPAIHVAGTNGKGSVAAMVERGLRASGYRTGRYTSPHLDRIEERVAIDGAPVDPARLRSRDRRPLRRRSIDSRRAAHSPPRPPFSRSRPPSRSRSSRARTSRRRSSRSDSAAASTRPTSLHRRRPPSRRSRSTTSATSDSRSRKSPSRRRASSNPASRSSLATCRPQPLTSSAAGPRKSAQRTSTPAHRSSSVPSFAAAGQPSRWPRPLAVTQRAARAERCAPGVECGDRRANPGDLRRARLCGRAARDRHRARGRRVAGASRVAADRRTVAPSSSTRRITLPVPRHWPTT